MGLRRGQRFTVERGQTPDESIDKRVEVVIVQRPVHPAIALGDISVKVVTAKHDLKCPRAADQTRRAAGRPGEEDQMLDIQADTDAYYGWMKKARDLARRATDSAIRSGAKETGALWITMQALREVEVENTAAAREDVNRAMALAPGRDVKVLAAVALARIGEVSQSKKILESLERSEPGNTYLKVYWFPVVEASMAMARKTPDEAYFCNGFSCVPGRGKAVREPRLAMTLGAEPHWVKRSNERESTGLLFRYKNKIGCGGSELTKWTIMKCKPKG